MNKSLEQLERASQSSPYYRIQKSQNQFKSSIGGRSRWDETERNRYAIDDIINQCDFESQNSFKKDEGTMIISLLKDNYHYKSQTDTMSKLMFFIQ